MNEKEKIMCEKMNELLSLFKTFDAKNATAQDLKEVTALLRKCLRITQEVPRPLSREALGVYAQFDRELQRLEEKEALNAER